MSPTERTTTLRLLMPQWQGGNNPPYHFGAQLLAWLAPPASGPVETVDVESPASGALPIEGGIVGRRALLAQLTPQSNASPVITRNGLWCSAETASWISRRSPT